MKGIRCQMRLVFLLTFALIIGIASSATAAIVLYSNDFDGNETFYTGVTGGLSGVTGTESVQGYSAVAGFSGNLLRNATTGNPASYTTLTLSNLPTHTSIDINFLFAFIDSWDSTNGSPAPDWFNVKVDGVSVLQITAANASGSNTYGGTVLDPLTHRGWWGNYGERAFDMSSESALSIAHSTSTLTIDFFASGDGWQGGSDESWAIENLQVTANPVPLPGALLLFAPGLAGLLAIRRRFRK
ncbi:MAG: hypothetical protein A4E72_01137 [Syntrophus sp. PtaU1.Bin208]|nr:MAG: hypothetical protein A4E72_01137 [Syntrophus sp. PtaU1.Bin208]